jgi:dynein heavy chain, axonemal
MARDDVTWRQSTARRNEWPLDKTINQVEVTKKLTEEEVDGPSREGAFVHGLMVRGQPSATAW